MSLSIFDDKTLMPTDALVEHHCNHRQYELWQAIRQLINESYPKINEEWKFYSKKAGWSLVIKSNKRTLIYLIPTQDAIKVNFVFGQKATEMILKENFSVTVQKLLKEATSYAEGRPIMFDIVDHKDVDEVRRLLAIKYTN